MPTARSREQVGPSGEYQARHPIPSPRGESQGPSSPKQPQATHNNPQSTSTPSAPSRSSGPSRHYAFPPPPSPPPSGSSFSSQSPTSPRGSMQIGYRHSAGTIRPRRPSPLLHEIQPPSRRLSPHQMLLLTPFGSQLPVGALGLSAGSSDTLGMSRGSSSMGRTPPQARGPSMIPSPTSTGAPISHTQRYAPRTRHQSLGLPPPLSGPSPLTSAPMTTIPSASETGSSSGQESVASSREASAQGDVSMEEDLPSLVGGTPGTVPMTRSTSLPVMTLRELQALQEKDEELGIAPGRGWAWMSSKECVIEETSPVTSNSSLTPPSAQRSFFPFTAFSDPFAPGQTQSSPEAPMAPSHSSSVMSRHTPPMSTHQHQPTATLAGYHYSPTFNDTRRMSEAPTVDLGSHPSSPATTIGRRPSAPVYNASTTRSSFAGSEKSSGAPGPALVETSPRDVGSDELKADTEPVRLARTDNEPVRLARTDNEAVRSARTDNEPVRLARTDNERPKIIRYKSLPGRHEGLGLDIVVRSRGPSAGGTSTSDSSGESHRGSDATAPGRRRSTRSRLSGTWVELDVVESLAATDLGSTSTSPLSSARHSITSVGSPPTLASSSATSSIPESLFLVEEITSRAHLAEFGGGFGQGQAGGSAMAKSKGRARQESVDPAAAAYFGFGPNVGYVAQLAQGGWNATFPRRGSLAVLTRTALGPWASGTDLGGLGVGGKEAVEGGGKHWSDRRGSWAEGWSKS